MDNPRSGVAHSGADGGDERLVEFATAASNRAQAQQLLNLIQSAGTEELFKRLYARPDYRAVINAYTSAMLRRFEDDPQAFQAYREVLARYDLEVSDRLPPLVAGAAWYIGGGAAFGVVVGFVSGLLD